MKHWKSINSRKLIMQQSKNAAFKKKPEKIALLK